MLPQIVGPGAFTPSPFAPTPSERASQGALPAAGETAAARLRPETSERVDPPRTLPDAARLPGDRPRRDPLLPPDPDAPAGPPPAFDATPLERAREAALTRDLTLDAAAEPDGRTGGPPRDGPADDDGLRRKTEAEIAEVRRMAAPEGGRGVDVVL